MLPESSKCQHFLVEKQRHCKFEKKPGFEYCGNHLRLYSDQAPKRVACPIDPSHEASADRLKDHIRKCPTALQRTQRQAQPYFSEDCNTSPGAKAALQPSRVKLAAEYGRQKFQELVQRVESIVAQECKQEEIQDAVHPCCRPLLQQTNPLRPFKLRHAQQQASIVSNLLRFGLAEEPERQVFIEFCAGTGYLTTMLSDALSPAHLVMVDRQTFRLKADRSLRQTESVSFQRILLDIKDFRPTGLQCLQDSTPWVAVGKHLCGAATDFMLRCCNSSRVLAEQGHGLSESGGQDEEFRAPVKALRGLAVSTCCHHRCEWVHYVGQTAFSQWGLSSDDFELISWMTGWALCGHDAPAGQADATKKDGDDEGTLLPASASSSACAAPPCDVQDRHGALNSALVWPGSTPAFAPHACIPRACRIEIGQKCKRLLDMGRLLWLREQQWTALSVLYVAPDITGENRLLLAK